MTSIPQPPKPLTSRVATAAPYTAAVAEIMASSAVPFGTGVVEREYPFFEALGKEYQNASLKRIALSAFGHPRKPIPQLCRAHRRSE